MPPLYLQDGQLLLKAGALAESDDCCCCKTPSNLCVFYSKASFNLSVAESLYGSLYIDSTGVVYEADRLSYIPCSAGFLQCQKDQYTVVGFVKKGSSFDDFGSVQGISFDNSLPCPNGKITSVDADSARFPLSWVVLPTCPYDQPRYVIGPIAWSASSTPSCKGNTYISATLCLEFTKKL